jgi:predicted PurR-regulated permease PerM
MLPDQTDPRTIDRLLRWTLLGLLIIGCLLTLLPFLSALLWALILAVSVGGAFRWTLSRLKGRRTLAALAVTTAVSLIFLTPFLVVGLSLGHSIGEFALEVQRIFSTGLPTPPEWLGKIPFVGGHLHDYLAALAGRPDLLQSEVRSLLAPLKSFAYTGGTVVVAGLFQLCCSILILFFLLRDGEELAARVKSVLERVAGPRGWHFVEVGLSTVSSVIYGILGTAVVQGVMAGIGFLIAGIPGAVLLGLLTFFLSVVPMGPPIVWVPACLWLFNHGSVKMAIFLAIWGVGVSSIDNVVKPWLISRGSDLPFILIFCGVLGGALAFGVVGIFLGPSLLAVGYRLALEWAQVGTAASASESSPTPPIKAD